ncbi:MAG TPA: sulfatase [Chitinophagaceae bacterium]
MFKKQIYFLLLFPIAISFTSKDRVTPNIAKSKPNILFVIADDWSLQAGAYGDSYAQTPNFDRVAREGALFMNSFCVAPTCTASRSSVLTGRFSHNLETAGNLWGLFPKKYATYPHILEQAGYYSGYTKKGWGPGKYEDSAWGNNPAGWLQENFQTFFEKSKEKNQPFCFWHGSHAPHRPYKKGIGIENGFDPKKIKVPDYLPDNDEVRNDLADYYYYVKKFDDELGEILTILERAGQLENTLIIVTSDNGMPFPRSKSSLYDIGTHMPFAMMWKGKIKPRQKITENISHVDIAPTILEAAGLPVPKDMEGKSLLSLVNKSSVQKETAIYTERERHAYRARENNGSYPSRSIRTDQYILIKNFRPDRWPGGSPINPYVKDRGFGDVDGSPSKNFILRNMDTTDTKPFFLRAFGLRPALELYDLKKDPNQFTNLAADPKYVSIVKKLSEQLLAWMKRTKDPRALGETDIWDTYPYFGKNGNNSTEE